MRNVVAATAVVALLVSAWRLSPLRDLADVDALVRYGRGFADSPVAPLILLVVYLVATLSLLPLTLLIAATLVVFGAWPGFAYVLIASLTSGAVGYGLGRRIGRDAVSGWLERRGTPGVARFVDRVVRHGLSSVALVRLTPIPFTLVNLACGASRIRFVDFMVGTALGLLPVTALLAGLATRIDAWLAHPDPGEAVAIAAIAIAAVASLWALRRWAMRRGAGG